MSSGAAVGLLGFSALWLLVGVFLGASIERGVWQQKTMGDLCREDRPWACLLHPSCEMHALFCVANPDTGGKP